MDPGFPIFPTMVPDTVDRLWFSVDEPKNEETEIMQIETVHNNWLLTAVTKINDKDFPLPIGKQANEMPDDDDDDEDEEEEANHSEESETHDEEEDEVEMETTNSYGRDSPGLISTR